MMKDKSFKITLLMYVGILILPIVFYTTLSQLGSLRSCEHTLRILASSGGEIEAMAAMPDKKEPLLRMDKKLRALQSWFADKDNANFYVGRQTPLKDYRALMQCWEHFRKDPSPFQAQQCQKEANSLAFNIEKLIALKIDTIQNRLYMTLAGSMLLLILLVFFIREYMQYQARKQAIYDYETKLYNKKYLVEHLKTSCARAARYRYPLSLLSVTISGYDADRYDPKARARLFGMIGGLISSLTRESDAPCRLDENHFLIILPFTSLEQSAVLEARMKKEFEAHDFMVEPKPVFAFSAITLKEKETPEACLARAQEECCPDFH